MTTGEDRETASAGGGVPILLVSGLLAANLAIVGPRTIYVANATEYGTSYWSVFWLLAAAAVLLAVVFALLQAALPQRWRDRALVFVFSLGVLAWLQGNWFVGNFGLLDGDALDFAAESGSRSRDLVMWLGGIALAQVFQRVLRPHVAVASGVFLLLQLIVLPLDHGSSAAGGGEPDRGLSLVADDEIFEFSSRRNIVLVIVDTMTSDTFAKFADAAPARYDAIFSGFTFYADTTGAFPSTQYSLPVMLGAQPYDNRVPIDAYMRRSLGQDSINGPLIDAGFVVDWVSAWPLFCVEGRYSSCYAIPRPYESPAVYRLQMAAQLIDLSLFRHAPYDLKRAVYRDGVWLLQSALWRKGDEPVFVSSAAAFFGDFTAEARVGRDQPTFKILHTAGGHGPFVLDEDCAAVPSQQYSAASYERQMLCSIRQLQALLGRLRELGVYDRSLIVVAGDHGASFGARPFGVHGLTDARLSRARPLLAVKWPGDSGGLRRSLAPASIADIAATIAAYAAVDSRLPGRDLATLEAGELRTRSYGLYVLRKGEPGGYLERVERYRVAPESRKPAAWSFDEVVFSPEIGLDARTIVAGTPESATHFSYLGWGPAKVARDGTGFVPAVGPVATVFVEFPRAKTTQLVASVRVLPWALPQTVVVDVDGATIGSLRIEREGFTEHTIDIPGRSSGPGLTSIRFRPANTDGGRSDAGFGAFDLAWIRLTPWRGSAAPR